MMNKFVFLLVFCSISTGICVSGSTSLPEIKLNITESLNTPEVKYYSYKTQSEEELTYTFSFSEPKEMSTKCIFNKDYYFILEIIDGAQTVAMETGKATLRPATYNFMLNSNKTIICQAKEESTQARKYQIVVHWIYVPIINSTPVVPGQIQMVSPQQPVFREGDRFEAMCVVPDGRPAANITWYLDENQLLENIHQPILTPPTPDDRQTISQNMTRVLSADDDGRRLICRAEHVALQKPREASRQLSVHYPLKRLEVGTITIFGLKLFAEGRLNVTVRANPPPRAQWLYAGKWLNVPHSSDDGNVTALEPIHLGGGYYNLSLVLAGVSKEDLDRVYYLRARNDLGHEEFVVRISTMDGPAGGHSYSESFFYRNAKILIIAAGTAVVILFLVIACKISHKLCNEKSACRTVTLPFALLCRKMRRETDATAVLSEKWTKVVTVEILTKDASIWPIVSIKRVKESEFTGRNASGLSTEYILPADKKWELRRQNLSFGDILGEGEFGTVLKAEYVGTKNSRVPNIVAVKMLKDDHTDFDMTALVSEMEIMKMIGRHENVVNFLGCCGQDGPLCVVVEYASNGCLREFLIKHNPKRSSEGVSQLKERNLVEFALQVAKGMEFLVSKGCIHRDLAARNVLVSEDLTLKIADFGLARDVGDCAYYRKKTAGKLPVRWMSPESLKYNYYTEHSDVWSFGVLFWEIMTFGGTPYRKLAAHFLYDYLKTGQRLTQPDGCQQAIYALMLECWRFDPENRPCFSELVVSLQDILNQTLLKSHDSLVVTPKASQAKVRFEPKPVPTSRVF